MIHWMRTLDVEIITDPSEVLFYQSKLIISIHTIIENIVFFFD